MNTAITWERGPRRNLMRRIRCNESVCVNCRLCEVHCRVAHSKSGEIIRAFKKEKTPPSRIAVEEAGPVSLKQTLVARSITRARSKAAKKRGLPAKLQA